MATVGFNMHKVQKGKVSSRAICHRNERRNDAARLSVRSLLVRPGLLLIFSSISALPPHCIVLLCFSRL